VPAINLYERDMKKRLREPGIGLLDRVPIKECNDPFVPLKGISPRIRLKMPIPWVRREVADMLVAAAESLPEGLFLVVVTGYRSLKMQARAYRRYRRHLCRKHPTWPACIVRREANRFLHPADSHSPPGHCTGGAVDVALAYRNGRQLDTTSSEIPDANTWATFYRHLTPVARANRALLYSTMLKAGFTNCYDEWWHYSYGDTAWAVRLGKPYAIYDRPAELPPAMARAVARAEKQPPRRIRL